MVVCPKCGKSHYAYLYGTRTLLGWTPVYKDGKLVNKDPNTTTHHLECKECGHQFTTTEDIFLGVDLDEVQTK
jgi:DNA-directed RNA polymerase subunit M/transcription elongation factor TFIIS